MAASRGPGELEIYRTEDGTELAVVAATWHVQPKVTFEALAPEFERDAAKAWRNYGSRVEGGVDLDAIKDKTLVARLANRARVNPWNDQTETFESWFRGDPTQSYFLHLDLAKRHDAAGVALCHRVHETGRIIVDFMDGITAKNGRDIQIAELRDRYVIGLQARGFYLKVVSVDQWQCVARGTRINTGRGLLSIEDVRVGDTVQTRLGTWEPVAHTFYYPNAPTVRIETEEGPCIETTRTHRLARALGTGRRWRWAAAASLKPGHQLCLNGGQRATVTAVTPSRSDVFDIEVKHEPSYIANGFISHNSLQLQQELSAKGFTVIETSADKSKAPYDTMIDLLSQSLLDYYLHPRFIREMNKLRKYDKKYDHIKNEGKDLSDAVACSAFNCLTDAIDNPTTGPSALTVIRARRPRQRQHLYE